MRLPLAARRLDLDEVAMAYASAALPPGRRPWREARWCALDLEMTGLDPRKDEIISFGAIPIEAGRLQLFAAVSALVRPSRAIGELSIPVHGIRDIDLESAPTLPAVIGPLLEAITGSVLVLHSAAIDRPFLKRALRETGLRLRNRFVDTEWLGRLWLHERDGRLRGRLSLGDLASALGLPADRPHDSLGDALTTAQAFLALATHLDALASETVSSLVRASDRVDAIRMFQDPLRYDG
ncbi:MAG: 3'-5' exonuclease [Solirubrobacterales bacterium]|nr:3'-5' exonuclease [Solirubrobacterales bacterium]